MTLTEWLQQTEMFFDLLKKAEGIVFRSGDFTVDFVPIRNGEREQIKILHAQLREIAHGERR